MASLTLTKVPLEEHTMGESLLSYIDMKMHPLLKSNNTKPVKVIGNYLREVNSISTLEKSNKLFNWKRPTVIEQDNNLIVNCYPGSDYVFHYGNLIANYYSLTNKYVDGSFIFPSVLSCVKELCSSNLTELPKADVIILGYVEQLSSLVEPQEWKGSGDFLYKLGKINSQSVMLLGCKHSYWADISGHLVNLLASKTKLVIYVGKLGSLNPSHKPNQTLTTGNSSFINNKYVTWNNIFNSCKSVEQGIHYNLPSVIQETKNWLHTVKDKFSFVDPEIGYMAEAANTNNIGFSYLHICSDNLSIKMNEDLSNERNLSVLNKRAFLLNQVKTLLKKCCKTK